MYVEASVPLPHLSQVNWLADKIASSFCIVGTAGKFTLFNGLKVNQQVHIYGDFLGVSYPPLIRAYAIEKITDDY